MAACIVAQGRYPAGIARAPYNKYAGAPLRTSKQRHYSRKQTFGVRADVTVPGAVFKTNVQLYLLDSGDNDTFSYNFYTNNWSGTYNRNQGVDYRTNYVNASSPNGRLMENHTSTSQDQPDGVHFGGYAVHNSGDRDLPRADYQPDQVLVKYLGLGGADGVRKTWVYPDDANHPDGRWGSSVTGDWRIIVTTRQYGPGPDP